MRDKIGVRSSSESANVIGIDVRRGALVIEDDHNVQEMMILSKMQRQEGHRQWRRTRRRGLQEEAVIEAMDMSDAGHQTHKEDPRVMMLSHIDECLKG